MTDAERKRAECRAACAAFDAMPRPKKPPPMPREVGRVRSAGELALEREKRMGLYSMHGAYFHD